MGNQSDLKALRSQLRQVVKDILPDMQKEVLYSDIMSTVMTRVKELEKEVKDTLHTINERHKDTMNFLTREMLKAQNKPSEIKPEGTTNE